MTHEPFIITVRPADLRHIYREKLAYRAFSKDRLPALLSAAFFLMLTALSLYKALHDDAFFFLFLCFGCAFGYQALQVLRDYWQFKKEASSIESWIADLQKYGSHAIRFGEGSFTYLRDGEIFVYDMKAVKKTYRTDDYFYFMGLDNMDIVLPKASFAPGDFERFIQCFDERISS